MKVHRAVITAASRSQRTLPLQTLVDRDGEPKSLLRILVEEAVRAGIEEVCVVLCPGDEPAYRAAADAHADRLSFVPQEQPRGYGHAVWCARAWVGDRPFLHMIGDHVYVSGAEEGSAEQIVATARTRACSVSGVQATRESQLPYFGVVGGQRVPGTPDLYRVEQVVEKPSPTEAEQTLLIPGLRAGHYLCFFGMHVLTPVALELLEEAVRQGGDDRGRIELSPVLNLLAGREKYLAVEARGQRYPVDTRYGLLAAQLGLALGGRDREEVLALLCDLMAQRELAALRRP